MSSCKFIINADDLGLNKAANGKIKEYAERHLISSAVILANGDAFDEAKSIALTYTDLSIGAHLNLTQFRSLTKAHIFEHAGITDKNNVFTGVANYQNRKSIKLSYELNNAIYKEWDAQISKLYDHGIKLSHIDGHNLVHYRKEFFFILKRLQKRFKIKRVRIRYGVRPYTFFVPFSFRQYVKGMWSVKPAIVWNAFIRYFPPITRTTNYLYPYISLYKALKAGHKLPRKGIFELIVHPGCDYVEYFAEENRLVEDRAIPNMVPGFDMITFNDI